MTALTKPKPLQKIISFSEDKADIEKTQSIINEGWSIVKLVPCGNHYVGVMEKVTYDHSISAEEQLIYIPPKKKISFS
ncbi:DUF2674 domain-containing protein [Candidatus Tisiphia endosymbiont of Nemotelus uliginosus]|uniref:DUF2674 domain-containing protein n=1 Tax=Candidatus Tisiphia endosymbiont of Nemotelus uliginosus TaxID=3077926 RepID=UPI0035C8E56D